MYDHTYIWESGEKTKIADLPTWKIHELLGAELQVDDEGRGFTAEHIRDRLNIELIARSL
jgi:hypothetical protein